MSKAKTLLKLSALSLAVGLYGCTGSDGGKTAISCVAPEVLNSAGTACVVAASDDLIAVQPNQAVVYYKREDGVYNDWGLHIWDDLGPNDLAEGVGTDWASPMMSTGTHPLYGAYWVIDLTSADWEAFKFVVRDLDGAKDIGGADLTFSKALYGNDVFLFEGVSELFADAITEIPVVLSGASAHFISYSNSDEGAHIVYDARSPLNTVELWYSGTGSLAFDTETLTVSGGEIVELSVEAMTDAQKEAYPHLASLSGYYLEEDTIAGVKDLLTGQLWIVESKADTNEVIKLTRVQTAPVIDNLFYEAAKDVELGAIVDGANTTFNLWAPTAQAVSVKLYDDEKTLLSTHDMTKNYDSGVWSVVDVNAPHGTYYRYDMEVFHYVTENVESYEVTDPYSLSLSTNSRYSQVVDLATELQPAGWDTVGFYELENPEDLMIYEIHVRDISLWDRDAARTAEHDGKYLAFTDFTNRDSMIHLNNLKDAGLNAIQFLPVFDIATIDENAANRVDIFEDISAYCDISAAAAAKAAELEVNCESGETIEQVLASFDASSSDAQDFYQFLRPKDSFNWGYDPFHYTVPEGSYATDPEGTARITEFREMVAALKGEGFAVVMDVVYNHTNASGLNEKSVLDKVVPGYYHRRDTKSGVVIQDSCCPDTATEHLMMSKLMTDSLVTWAREYKIDGFRFDLMGLQTKSSMEAALAAVQDVNEHVYFYGEGWNYGAAGDNKRGINGSQANMAGTGIGTFTDRLRDAVRGGGPFDNMDGEEKSLRRNQGLSTSAIPNELNLVDSVDPDANDPTTDNGLTPDQELAANVLKNADIVRLGLAANLKTFAFTASDDKLTTGAQLKYGDSPAGYAEDPQEIINYVSKHDNQTLWDIIAYKAADEVTSVDRAKMQSIAVATSAFAQGIPFFHMGVDLLRSKSMERDSYDSGDWYNKVDFAVNAESQWNVGLPREDKDGSNWAFIKEVTAKVNAAPTGDDVAWMRDSFIDILEMRLGSPLFRLTSGDEVKNRIAFHNTGSEQIAGVIAMSIDDGVNAGADLDENVDALLVMFNYTDEPQTLTIPAAEGLTFTVRGNTKDEAATVDNATQAFTIPALSYAVFQVAQGAEQGDGLPAGDVPPFVNVELRASFTGWTDVPFFYAGEGVYKLSFVTTAEVVDGAFGIRTDGAWNAHDQNVNFTGSTVAIGGSEGNAIVSLAAATRYEMTYDATNNAFTIAPEAAATFASVQVKGSFIDSWGTELPFNYLGLNRYELYYTATADVTGGEFGILTDGNWNAHGEGVNFEDSEIKITGTGNALISLTSGTEYRFFYDSANKVFKASVFPQPYNGNQLSVNGEVGAASNTMTYIGVGVYEAQFAVDPANFSVWGNANNFDFKIVGTESNPDLGNSLTVTLPEGFSRADGGTNIGIAGIEAVTTLKFTFNAIEQSVVVEVVAP